MNEQTQLVTTKAETQSVARPLPNSSLLPGNYLYDAVPESEHIAYLRDFLRSVRKYKWLVLGLVFCATAAAIVYNARQPDIYEARAQVKIDQESGPARAALGNQSPIIISNGQGLDPQYFNTQLQILTGPALMRRVAYKLDLERNPNFFRSSNQNRTVTQSVLRMFGLDKEPKPKPDDRASAPVVSNSNAPDQLSATKISSQGENVEGVLQEARRMEPYVQALLGGLRVSQVRETRLIELRYTHQDPQLAAKVINTLAETYVTNNLIGRSDRLNNEGDFLDKRITKLDSELKNLNQELNDYSRRNDFLDISAGQDVVVERLAKLNGELITAENERRLAEAQYNVGKEKPVVDAATDKEALALEDKLNALVVERARLAEIYTDEWQGIKQIDAQIVELKKQVTEIRARRSTNNVTALKARYDEAVQRENALRRAFEQQKGETRTQNVAAVQYRLLKQEVETKQKLLEDLIGKKTQQDIVKGGLSNNISVQEWSLPPKNPVGPKRTQGILTALLLSLAFGIGLARLLDYLDTTVRTVQDIEKHVRLPVLALIPAVGGWRRIANSTALQRRSENATQELLLHTDARSPLAETYRQLRTSILLSTAGRAPKTLLVTSSQASEGKTTNAVNIAYTLTQTRAKVLLIDADMRRPRLHSVFQMENTQGLSTALSSSLNDEDIVNLALRYEESDLYVMPSGPLPPNPSELLSSEAMRKVLVALEKEFTHIVIDSPPITLVTDSVILGSMVDGVIIVVHGDRTSRELVRRSQRLLSEVGARIFGVILNNVNVKPEDYYYYQSYYGSRYYAENAAADNKQ